VPIGRLLGGIEAGGTKFECVVGTDPKHIVDRIRILTADPASTFDQVSSFFKPYCAEPGVAAIGIGSFGPLDLNPTSRTFGCLTTTPKPGWAGFDLLGELDRRLGRPVSLETDVHAAALGEYSWGAAVGDPSCLYVTVGTGIGAAYLLDGHSVYGFQHSEMGHIRLQRDASRDPFIGVCPYHGDCFEGLASGPAIERRLGRRGEVLEDAHPFWDLEADYIASALASYILILAPHRIVLGGGIMQREFLFSRIRSEVVRILGGYVRNPAFDRSLNDYIVAPALGTSSGVFGALILAAQASSTSPTA
jgi:fructokinase